MVNNGRRSTTDRGSVLVITLVLSVILAVLVLALANFVTVGLRTSDVASERTESNADASAVMSWAVEQFAKKQLTPGGDCGEAPTYVTIPTVPASLSVNGSTTTLECAQTNPITGESAVHLIARSTGVQARVVEATVLVPLYSHGARVADWRVDIPIDVPEYVTTTTVVATTSTLPPNQAPVAQATNWTLNDGSTSLQSVVASDPDGSVSTVNIAPAQIPTGWSINHVSGSTVEVTVPAGATGSETIVYTVTDDGGLESASATITVNLTTSPTTTTTTPAPLPPSLTCVFRVTSADGDQKAGIGSLSVTNSGGEAIGWEARISWPNWSASWPVGLSVTTVNVPPNGTQRVVVGPDTIAQGATVNYSVALTWDGGNPKIVLDSTRSCSALAP